MNNNLQWELPESEYNEWKEAHKGKELSDVSFIIENMKYPAESFAEASARLGYGNDGDAITDKYYYNRKISILKEE